MNTELTGTKKQLLRQYKDACKLEPSEGETAIMAAVGAKPQEIVR